DDLDGSKPGVGIAEHRLAGHPGPKKMLTLVLEGFAGRYRRADHITGPGHQLDLAKALVGRLPHRPLVEDADRFLGLEVVERRHLAAAHHRDLAHFSRIEPARADV